MACGILVPQPGIETAPSAVKALSPNHWTAREFLPYKFWMIIKPMADTFFLPIYLKKGSHQGRLSEFEEIIIKISCSGITWKHFKHKNRY